MITDFQAVSQILDGKESGYFNMDCMEGMKAFPDNFFDLAIVDPPYGDGGGVQDSVTESVSGKGSTNIGGVPRTGFHGKQYSTEPTLHFRTAKEGQELREQAEHGRRSSQKNYRVGRCAGERIF